MTTAEAFFIPDGDHFKSTELCRGPWNPEYQHGGPPAALMARAVEQSPGGENPFQVARMTVEFLSPVPLSVFSIKTEVIRSSKKTQLIQVWLSCNDSPVCRAMALLIRKTRISLPSVPSPGMKLKPPAESPPLELSFFPDKPGYHKAMELRITDGTFGSGAVAAWFRMRYPLVPGETPSPLQRVMIAADSGNGISMILDPAQYIFINPDLTVYLHRLPEGEWVGLDAATTPQPSGVGFAESALYDEHSSIGRSLQSLVVDYRTGK